MSKEKFISGKKDDCKHEGKRGEIKRIQEAENQLKDYWQQPEQESPYKEFKTTLIFSE